MTKNATACPNHPAATPAAGSHYCAECHQMLRRNFGWEIWIEMKSAAK